MPPPKWIYPFGKNTPADTPAANAAAPPAAPAADTNNTADTNTDMRHLLGNKGANLATMARLGLPVPPGFILPTTLCAEYHANDRTLPAELRPALADAITALEAETGRGFGNPESPLLLSVRSGAAISMPGMMDTALNIGINAAVAEALATRMANPDEARFAWDTLRRFIQNYGDVVLDMDRGLFEEALADMLDAADAAHENALDAAAFKKLAGIYNDMVTAETGSAIPESPHDQLHAAITAVMDSWMNARAITYREIHDMQEGAGTAVVVQAMVFGNRSGDSATGVGFTRDPVSGAKRLTGEYLACAQGEDVVAGMRTPAPLSRDDADTGRNADVMREATQPLAVTMPGVFAELAAIGDRLEAHYRDMQDVEFTIEQGRLYILQTRSGKRGAVAALRIAVEMVGEGLLARDEALLRMEPESLDRLLAPCIDRATAPAPLTRGLAASPGAAIGAIVLDADAAIADAENGRRTILIRNETSPDDIHGMHVAAGILTARGGMTCHAALVARGMGRPCICGAGEVVIAPGRDGVAIAGQAFRPGDVITIDGGTGEVFAGALATVPPDLGADFNRNLAVLMEWTEAVIAGDNRSAGDESSPAAKLTTAQEILKAK